MRQVRAAGFQITAVLGDADFGDNTRLRRALHHAGLPYALGISSELTVFRETPTLRAPALRINGRPRLPDGVVPLAVDALVASWPARAWRTIRWRNAPHAHKCSP